MMSNNKQGGIFNIIFSIIVLFVLCGVLVISACYAVTPTIAEQIVKNQQQQNNNNNNNEEPQEFTYIKNLIHSQADRNEYSNILINDQDFIGNQRRTYLQQFRDKLVNTHKGKLHFDIKLDDEEEDDEEEEESGAGKHSSNLLNYQIYNVDEADVIDLEQQKHAHTDEDNGDDTTQLDSVSLVRRNNIDGTSGSSSDGSSTTSNQSSKGNAGMPSSNTNGAEITNTRVKLLFDPPSLDFEERPLCNPIAKTFTITKEDGDEEEALQITSVSTDSLLFHPSINKKENNKIIINVIFLPRILKRSEGVIIINTNFGVFTYKAFGGGIENAYNIKPILGHKLPVGADYRKPIFMHNPHQNESLLIKEIYTSEDFLLLSLPDQNSNDKTYNKKNPLLSLWKIEPHLTKSIILLNFHANQPKKHTGFVHINTNRGQFIIPVEFIVSKSGVHRVVDEIDFGTFISANEKRTRDIVLLNSSPNPVLVSEASIANTDAQLKLEFTKNTILQEGSISSVAKVTFSSQIQGEFTGKIIFKTNDTTSKESAGIIEVPYRSRIIHGTLDYRMNSTAFYCGDGKEKFNEMILMNGFDVPIKFTSADVFDKRFTIEDFTPGSVLEKGSKKRVLSIRFNPSDSYLIHKTNLILHTNITRLYIPLYSYHGNLDHIPINAERNILDIQAANEAINIGILGLGSRKIHYFTISNMNPVPIKIFDWKVTGMTNKKSSISISYVKIYQPEDDLGSLTLIKPTKLSDNINSKHADGAKDSFIFAILPNQKIIMRLDIYTPTSDEEQNGFIEFTTQYKPLTIPLKFICMEGSLSITNQLPFDVTFPGKIQKKNIYATNTFGRAITISEIKTSDERFIPVITHKTIEANQKMNIGYVTLDASKVTKEKNYMMDDGKSSSGSYNKKSSTISSEEFTKFRWRNSLFEDIKNAGDTNILGTISLQTDIGINYSINVSTSLEYPKLSPVRQINFKLTHIGTSASQYLTVENPSDHFISLQLILGNGSLAKFLQRNAKGNVPKTDGQGDKSYTEFRLPKDGMNSANIPPHRHANLGPIIFTPKSDSATSVAYLYIRNNLTIFDIVKLTGNGGSSKLIFSENGNDLASLKFEIKESQLGTWDNYTNRFVQNNYSSNNGSEESSQRDELIFHKKFILQNKGNMPVMILGSSIENIGCSAYGVKLHKCGKFELQPGQTTSYKISYKPDFTTAVVDLFIRINTDQGKLSYPIRLTLPYNVLPYFYETQPISTGHRFFRVAATFIVLTLALYIIFRACRELKTLDSGDNELPTSITDFLKPNFSISSFPFITFPSMDAEKNNQNKNDEEKVLNAEEENKKKKSSEKSSEKKKKPKTNQSPSIPKSDKSSKKPKQTKPVVSHNNLNEEEESVEQKAPAEVPETETETTGEKTNIPAVVEVVELSPPKAQLVSITVKEEKEETRKPSQTNTTIATNNVTSESDNLSANYDKNVEKKSIYKKIIPDKKLQNDKKTAFTSSSKKKFIETEANIVIKPKVFSSVPNGASNNSNEKPKFYAVKAANGDANNTNSTVSNVPINDLSVLSPVRSRTPNSNEMARFGRENHQALSTTPDHHSNGTIESPSSNEIIKTRERSSSDSATYKNLLDNNPISNSATQLLDEKSTCSTDQDVGSTGNLSGLLHDSDGMAPSPSSTFVESDVLSLLRSASVSPPPVGQSTTTPLNTTTNQHKEQVGVIGSNNTRRDFGFGQASQPYWYFGGASSANSFFGQGNSFIGSNSNNSPFVPNPQFNAPPVVNRLAATFQHRPTNYFSLFDSRPNSLFSTDTNSSFFSNLNQRSNSSSPSNSDSTSGTPDITSSLFSYVLPAEDEQQHLK